MAAPARTVRTGNLELPVRPGEREEREAPAVQAACVAKPAQVGLAVAEETVVPAAAAGPHASNDKNVSRLLLAVYGPTRVQTWVSPNIGEPT